LWIAGQADGGEHGAVEGESTVFHGTDEGFVGAPIEVAEAFPLAKLDSQFAGDDLVDQFGAVDFLVIGGVVEVVGATEETIDSGLDAEGVAGEFRVAVHADAGFTTADDPEGERSVGDLAEGFCDDPAVVSAEENAAVGPFRVGDPFDGIDELAARKGLEQDISLLFGGEGIGGDAVDPEMGGDEEEKEKKGSEAEAGGERFWEKFHGVEWKWSGGCGSDRGGREISRELVEWWVRNRQEPKMALNRLERSIDCRPSDFRMRG
jgi:hypothetical protein